MKRFFIILSLAVFLFAFGEKLSAAEPQTMEDSKSIFFGFHGLSDLHFDNNYIGFQYLFADKMGLWADVSFNAQNSKPSEDAFEQKTSGVGFDVAFIYYLFQKGSVAMYFSPQINLIFSSLETSSASKTTYSDIGIGCSVGAEWWAWENVSFAVSTWLGYDMKTTIFTPSVGNEIKSTTNTFGMIEDKLGNITISFYF